MQLRWWGLLVILVVGFLIGAGAVHLHGAQARAALRQEIDSAAMVRKLDSTRSAERDAQFVQEINRLAALLEQQQAGASADSAAAAQARRRELAARRDRDTALARLDLTTEQLANVSREIAKADSAADQARIAGETEVRSVRITLATQVMHSAALQRRVDSLRAENSRLHTSVGVLETRLRDRINPAPPRGKLLGFLPKPKCGPGVAIAIGPASGLSPLPAVACVVGL